jgi:hypothetical protein
LNPSLPFYRGRFALLWHELPISPESELEKGCKNAVYPPRQLGEDTDPHSGEPSYFQHQEQLQGNAPSSTLGEDFDLRSGERSYSSHSHWDLMLELDDGQLLTWKLPRMTLANLLQVGHEFLGHRLPDHRQLYLDYEGPISNNRGWVKRIASGEYRVVMLGQATDSDSGEKQQSNESAGFDSPLNPLPSELVNNAVVLLITLQGQLNFKCLLRVQLTPAVNAVRIKVNG